MNHNLLLFSLLLFSMYYFLATSSHHHHKDSFLYYYCVGTDRCCKRSHMLHCVCKLHLTLERKKSRPSQMSPSMPAGVVLMMIGVSDWRGAVGVFGVVMCHCCMYMYTFSVCLSVCLSLCLCLCLCLSVRVCVSLCL